MKGIDLTTAAFWASVAAFMVSVAALVVGVVQTSLTRRAVRVAEETLKDAKVVLQAQMLSRGHAVTHVMVALEQWEKTVAAIDLERVRRDSDLVALRAFAAGAEQTPKGLVYRPLYEDCPPWLQEVYSAGAQHYYHGNGWDLWYLWDFKKDAPRFGVERELGAWDNSRQQRALVGLRELRAFLDRLLPAAWLEAPASMDIREFFDR